MADDDETATKEAEEDDMCGSDCENDEDDAHSQEYVTFPLIATEAPCSEVDSGLMAVGLPAKARCTSHTFNRAERVPPPAHGHWPPRPIGITSGWRPPASPVPVGFLSRPSPRYASAIWLVAGKAWVL